MAWKTSLMGLRRLQMGPISQWAISCFENKHKMIQNKNENHANILQALLVSY